MSLSHVRSIHRRVAVRQRSGDGRTSARHRLFESSQVIERQLTILSQKAQQIAVRNVLDDETNGLVDRAASQHADNVRMKSNSLHLSYFAEQIASFVGRRVLLQHLDGDGRDELTIVGRRAALVLHASLDAERAHDRRVPFGRTELAGYFALHHATEIALAENGDDLDARRRHFPFVGKKRRAGVAAAHDRFAIHGIVVHLLRVGDNGHLEFARFPASK